MSRRVEEKIAESPSIFLLILADSPLYWVHGAYSTEKKLYKELDNLAKLPENKITASQRRANDKAMGINKKMLKKSKRHEVQLFRSLHRAKAVHKDPMDRYTIREIVIQ